MPVVGHDVSYFDCPHCGYLQTESPHWLPQAYSSAINDVDTGILWRNDLNRSRVILTLAAMKAMRGRVLDYAGGYGVLVRLLRDAGVDAHWSDKYCDNLVARGFEADDQPYDLVTGFEVFEHLEHPVQELRAMFCKAPTVLISTELIPTAATPDPAWWYLGPEHGQHIGFFRQSTLDNIASQLGCAYRSDGRSLHIFTTRRLPSFWLELQRLKACWPLLVRLRLTSKLQTDFEALRQRR